MEIELYRRLTGQVFEIRLRTSDFIPTRQIFYVKKSTFVSSFIFTPINWNVSLRDKINNFLNARAFCANTRCPVSHGLSYFPLIFKIDFQTFFPCIFLKILRLELYDYLVYKSFKYKNK